MRWVLYNKDKKDSDIHLKATLPHEGDMALDTLCGQTLLPGTGTCRLRDAHKLDRHICLMCLGRLRNKIGGEKNMLEMAEKELEIVESLEKKP